MKFNYLHICLLLIFWNTPFLYAQQLICLQATEEYQVDIDENNGNGTSGSTYNWQVISSDFQGVISPITNSGNRAQINWGDTPSGQYQLQVTETTQAGCVSKSKLLVTIQEAPEIPLDQKYICPSGEEINLIAPTGYESYEWFNPSGEPIGNSSQISVYEIGDYELRVFNGLCYYSSIQSVVLADIPQINIETDQNNNVSVHLFNVEGNYLYQLETLDGEIIVPFQISSTFFSVEPGNYVVRLKSLKTDCEFEDIAVILFIPNIFTPNDDGVNDYWQITGLVYFPESEVQVYDRYGKLIKSLNTDNFFKWDGKYQGRALPSTSYWYKIIFKDGKTRAGWVVIKNRNSDN